jgi:hypothetical protein
MKTIVVELQSIVDERLYKVKASLGQGALSGIPWLAVMDREITESTQSGCYISYLFSRNAKTLHLSIALGATQFTSLYGDNNKTTLKIKKAKEQFVNNFNKYSPSEIFDDMDLIDKDDNVFIRDFSAPMSKRADHYAAGCFFTKSYNLQNPAAFNEKDIVDDLHKYVESYRKIVLDPASSALLDILDETVYDEGDKEKVQDFNYDIPPFDPSIIEKTKKTKKGSNVKQSKKPFKPSTPSKKVGDAGERYVYDYEFNRLSKKMGRKDLADRIFKQHEDLSHYPGYDIQSFDDNGDEIFIEVKSTKNKHKEYFEISDNEIKAAKKLGNSYYIYQVTSALTKPRISTKIQNPIKYVNENRMSMEPLIYILKYKN